MKRLSLPLQPTKENTIPGYQKPEDLNAINDLIKLAPQEAQAFLHLKKTAERADGVIPEKTRELISVAVALTTQCPYCIETHTRNAGEIGVTRQEIAEVTFITAALLAGSAAGHGLLALRLFDEANAQSTLGSSAALPTSQNDVNRS